MTSLIPLFTDAFMAEQKRYGKPVDYGRYVGASFEVWHPDTQHVQFVGTRADCERFVVERCARKTFEALRKEIGAITADQAFGLFLKELATEPETNSGDAG